MKNNKKNKKRNKKARRLPLFLTGALITGSLSACSNHPPKTATPPRQHDGDYNIVFITTDQERYFDTPPNGTNWRARQLLQSIGATFEKHYICSNMSTSSRSVIYTGRHITETKMTDNTDLPWQGALSEDIRTVGHMMRDAGYYTAYKGKFHLLNEGAIDIPDPNSEPAAKVNKKFQRQDDLDVYGFSDWNTEGDIAGHAFQGYQADEYIKGAAVRWLREKGAALNEQGTPFFIAVNFVNPHDIMFYQPAEGKTNMGTNAVPGNTVYEQRYDYLPPAWEHAAYEEGGIPAHMEFHISWSEQTGALPRDRETIRKFNDYYLNSIQDMDNSLMGLLEELERLGMMDNTIIILTSDHGEMGGSHGLKGKGPFMFENNIRVPFTVVHPAYTGGRRINAVTSHLDIVPTILDMTNLSAEKKASFTEGLSGRSLLPLLDGGAQSVRDGALYAFGMISTMDSDYNPFAPGAVPDFGKRGLVRGIITERYKFARYFSPLDFNAPATLEELFGRNDVELYDLKNDPHELRNLAATQSDREANAELIFEMNGRLNELVAREIGDDDGSEMAEALRFFGIER